MMLLTSAKLTGLVLLIVPAVIVPILTLGRRLRKLSKKTKIGLQTARAMPLSTLGLCRRFRPLRMRR